MVIAQGCALLLGVPGGVQAASDISRCVGLESDAARLACYDEAAGRRPAPAPDNGVEAPGPKTVFGALPPPVANNHPPNVSLLERNWDLHGKERNFDLRPYQPVYLLPLFHTTRLNDAPITATQGVAPAQGIQATESKFQISFKTKLATNMLGDNGDLWAGYTQSSRWQVYNGEISRPFRETNYEPEGMFLWKTNFELLGFKARYMSLGLNHQSNGRSDPFSRSWNRVIGSLGLERDNWTVTLRPWWRVPEKLKNDDNPDIADYAGRGEVLITTVQRGHILSLQARHALMAGEKSHGSLRLNWAVPISGYLRAHLEYFTGYGESMIDYNHRAQYLGLGISLVEWH